jgi:hypothetical protein
MRTIQILTFTAFFAFQMLISLGADKIPVTSIANNTKAIAIQNWLVAGPLPSEYLPNESKNSGRRSGYSTDFLTD